MKVNTDKVIAEFVAADEILVMDSKGQVRVFLSPQAVLTWLKKRSARRGADIEVTTVEWRNVPEGWEPPDA